MAKPTRDEIGARAHQLYIARGATNGDDVKDWLQAERELRREHLKYVNTFAPWLSAAATTFVAIISFCIAQRAYDLSVRMRAEAFEPRVIASTLGGNWEDATDPATGAKRLLLKSGLLSLRNIGKGDAVDVRCHIVNPFSDIEKPYAYHRFRSEPGELLGCSGEPLQEGFRRERAFGSILAPGEQQEFCVEDLDMDPTIFEAFLVIRCTYSDRDGHPKGGDFQEVAIPGSGLWYPTAELDTPAKEIIARYQSDPRVKRARAMWHPPATSSIPVEPTPTDSSPSSGTSIPTPPR